MRGISTLVVSVNGVVSFRTWSAGTQPLAGAVAGAAVVQHPDRIGATGRGAVEIEAEIAVVVDREGPAETAIVAR